MSYRRAHENPIYFQHLLGVLFSILVLGMCANSIKPRRKFRQG